MVASNTSCPYNIPMLRSDTNMTEAAMLAAIQDSERPISEYAKKEFFFKCASYFENGIKADKSLIADEIRKHCKRFDHLYGTHYQKPVHERNNLMKLTVGDYKRFSAVFYLMTRKLLLTCEMLVLNENKKRIMPRHIMASAITCGIIPYEIFKEQRASP